MGSIDRFDSDLHNFQMKARVENGRVIKNRSLFCEYSLYSSSSSFRKKIDELFPKLEILPYLNFDISTFDPTLGDQSYDFLKVSKIEREIKNSEVEQIGVVLAVMNFLGVADLHKTNILFGSNDEKTIFAPIDLECFFQHFYSNDVAFYPEIKTHLKCCSGVAQFLDYLTNYPDELFFVKLYYGYKEAMRKILENKVVLHELFLKQAKRARVPTRVVIKPTNVYAQYLGRTDIKIFINEENLQLIRNDIPYFFSFLDEPNSLYYWLDKFNYRKVEDFKLIKRVFSKGSLGISSDLSFYLFRNLCLLYTSPSPRDGLLSRMPSSA